MRHVISFACAGETLIGTLDEGQARTGLLIVSGGNEIRAGAHRGMVMLGQRLADDDFPVFRFDRRGIGDSTGENGGFESSAADIEAALSAFRAASGIERVIGFGNCDAATALALFNTGGAFDALVLANPWVVATTDDLPPAAAIRSRYAERLRDPASWRRLLRGEIDLRRLFRGLLRIAGPDTEASSDLVARMKTALAASSAKVTFVLAEQDATAIAFADVWRDEGHAAVIHRLPSASHSFAGPDDMAALEAILRDALAG